MNNIFWNETERGFDFLVAARFFYINKPQNGTQPADAMILKLAQALAEKKEEAMGDEELDLLEGEHKVSRWNPPAVFPGVAGPSAEMRDNEGENNRVIYYTRAKDQEKGRNDPEKDEDEPEQEQENETQAEKDDEFQPEEDEETLPEEADEEADDPSGGYVSDG